MTRSFERFQERIRLAGLYGRVESRALNHHVSLQDLYEGRHTASVVAARRAVYSWLIKEGKNVSEVADLFDRERAGIRKMLGRSG